MEHKFKLHVIASSEHSSWKIKKEHLGIKEDTGLHNITALHEY